MSAHYVRKENSMTALQTFIKRHSVLTYYIITFVISWGGMLILIGPGGFPVSADDTEATGPLMVAFLGPGIAGILLTAHVSGWAGLRELWSRLFRWRVGARWYAVALLLVPLLMAADLFAFSFLFDDFSLSLVTTDDKFGLLLTGIIVGLLIGTFEEVGWTGFAIPRLRLSYSVLSTGSIVGLIWGAWHFPMFWEAGSFAAALPLALLLARLFSWLPAYRVLMVWVYDRTGSVLLAIFMHASLLATQLILQPTTDSDALMLGHVLVLAAAMWIVVLAVTAASGGHLSRPGKPPASIGSPQVMPG
jgi:uncharacterized protein